MERKLKFKRYLNGVGDAGTCLLSKYVLDHMNLTRNWVDIEVEKLGKCMCNLCHEECESVSNFLWNCPVYSEHPALFLEHLKNNLGNEFEHFKS